MLNSNFRCEVLVVSLLLGLMGCVGTTETEANHGVEGGEREIAEDSDYLRLLERARSEPNGEMTLNGDRYWRFVELGSGATREAAERNAEEHAKAAASKTKRTEISSFTRVIENANTGSQGAAWNSQLKSDVIEESEATFRGALVEARHSSARASNDNFQGVASYLVPFEQIFPDRAIDEFIQAGNAQGLLNWALSAESRGAPLSARSALVRIIELPLSDSMLNQLVNLRVHREEYEQALLLFNGVLEISPSEASDRKVETAKLIAVRLTDAGDFLAAKNWYQRTGELDSEWAATGLEELALLQDTKEQLLEDLSRCVRLDRWRQAGGFSLECDRDEVKSFETQWLRGQIPDEASYVLVWMDSGEVQTDPEYQNTGNFAFKLGEAQRGSRPFRHGMVRVLCLAASNEADLPKLRGAEGPIPIALDRISGTDDFAMAERQRLRSFISSIEAGLKDGKLGAAITEWEQR